MEPIIKGDYVYVPSEAMPGVPIGKQSIGRSVVIDGIWYCIYHISTNTGGFMARKNHSPLLVTDERMTR